MKRNHWLIIVIGCPLFLLFGIGCKKDDQFVIVDGLTFGCKVNGKFFKADDWDYGNNIPPVHIDFSASFGGTTLIVRADKLNESVELFINKPLYKGKHELKFDTQPWPIYSPPKDNGVYTINYPLQYFITNDIVGGYVDLIEIDTVRLKVYATFEFTGTDKSTGRQVQVTDGVFKNF